MKRICLSIAFLAFISFAFIANDQNFVQQSFSSAAVSLKNMLAVANEKPLAFPRTLKNGKYATTDMYDWTPGFFPGSLWYAYEYTKDNSLKDAAIRWTEKLEPLKTFTKHHDLGFMVYCSYGNAYRLTGNKAYKDLLIQAGRSLSTRFNSTTGTIKSWNNFKSLHGDKTYTYPVIIDNMMNLELLFFASEASGDTTMKHIAIAHALNTMKNQIRKDYSSYHVVCYDPVSGNVLARETAQGYADNSTWARGQAWGIYGFTMCYRKTKDQRFLKTAEGMANFVLDHKNLPTDKIPYWDFNAREDGYTPGVNSKADQTLEKFRDASAGAIYASALLELSTYSKKYGAKFKQAAIIMLHALASKDYTADAGTNGNFILKHSVGSIAHGAEIDVPLVYADYYYLEALQRYNNLLNGKSVINERK